MNRFTSELERLTTRGATPAELEIARRYYSPKERESMPESSFCGPHQSFPITSQEDIHNAASLLHHADNPSEVKACIRAKAREHGWDLPKAWEDDEEKNAQADISRGAHDPMTGKHSHPHPAFGDQGGDDSHSHTHTHSDDNNHQHEHTTSQDDDYDEGETKKSNAPDILRSMPTDTTIFAPILRIDRNRREVIVRATAEDLDSYNTVIGYEASKAAFSNWRGNIREMHDSTKAVGRAIRWEPLEDEKAIDLTLRVSKGSEDTWQKVLDGTLAGASIGAKNGKWGKRQWKGQEVPFLERYDLVEVSLVDNPSCPGCDVKIVRSDNLATDVLDFSEEDQPEIERRGARVGSNTMSSMHKSRDHALQGVREMLSNCNCDECQHALHAIDPDMDGDIDIVDSLDSDHDAAKSMSGASAGDGSGIMKAVGVEITRVLGPLVARMNASAARIASAPEPENPLPDITRRLDVLSQITQAQPELTRRLNTLEAKLDGLDEVRSALAEVRDLAIKIASQPQSGGPIVNSAVLRQQEPPQATDPLALEAEVISRLSKSGILSKDQQVNAVLYLQRLQQQGMGARR